MKFFLNEPKYSYELENLLRLFFPSERIEFCDSFFDNELSAFSLFEKGMDTTSVKCGVNAFGKSEVEVLTVENSVDNYEKECERIAAIGLFHVISSVCGFRPQWGILTGVRPAKLLSNLIKQNNSIDKARDYFRNGLLVKDEKIDLCEKVYEAEIKALKLNKPSLYISIPFCPSRCSYCSFVSHSIAQAGKLIPKYTELLCKEIEYTAKIARELSLSLNTVYFGGGTPTQLSADQLEVIMKSISDNFDLSNLSEYTVEAGRPDTITQEKLKVLKKNGITRISINPQTLDDKILENIGRKHTVKQSIDAFKLARQEGFHNINMDLIAGLPNDTIQGFDNTIDGILDLSPENITVHTLALKKSSRLVTSGSAVYSADSLMISQMLESVSKKLSKIGYSPYYLYRQSKMVGNHENVGWSKPGYDCLYNIYMMNELHTVLAVGAGGVSRLKDPKGSHIERIFNFKYPYEYIERFDEMLGRKDKVGDFYERYPI